MNYSNTDQPSLDRRTMLKALAAGAAGIGLGGNTRRALSQDPSLPEPQALTTGPKCHWFGYYDKLQFDPSGTRVVCMEVDFEHRSPQPDDEITLGMIDLGADRRWTELGRSRAWCWQQRRMLQWLPGSTSEVISNDRQGSEYVSHILDVDNGRRRTLRHPGYAVSPDGAWAVAPSFSRLADVRPGYGYAGVPDPFRDEAAPKETGIFRVDLRTGSQDLIISLADVAKIPYEGGEYGETKHWFNHLLVNPDGSPFVFLHRWQVGNGRRSRMLSAKPDGSDLRVLIGTGWVSHFIWRDPAHMLAFSKTSHDAQDWGFFLWEDKPGGTVDEIGKGIMTGDGHCTYLPGSRWIVNDTYPDKQRKQRLYLFDTVENRRIELGGFFQSPTYWEGSPHHEWRVDLHPRHSPDGRLLTIDSPWAGNGRQLYLLDIGSIIGA